RWDGGHLDEQSRHHLIREIIGLFVDDVLATTYGRLDELNPRSSEAIQQHSINIVGHSEDIARMSRELKTFLYANMYRHYRVMRMSQRAEHFISRIFQSYIREPRQLPEAFYTRIEEEGEYRAVADYIASMTDRSAQTEFRRLYDPSFKP
ncbi:MAG: deoxyguanosinetriphosphate triphosphohydrolase, partial [Chloroflexota bacterium]